MAAKESGPECTCVNNDDFSLLVSGGGRRVEWACVLCGHLIENDWANLSNEPASTFALSLNIPLGKLLGWFRRPQLWTAGDWQLHHDNMLAYTSRLTQSFLVKHPGDSVSLQPRFGALSSWLFPKLKSILKGKRFQTTDKIQENIGQTVWGSKVSTLKGTEASLSYVQCFFCILYFFNKCIYFS